YECAEERVFRRPGVDQQPTDEGEADEEQQEEQSQENARTGARPPPGPRQADRGPAGANQQYGAAQRDEQRDPLVPAHHDRKLPGTFSPRPEDPCLDADAASRDAWRRIPGRRGERVDGDPERRTVKRRAETERPGADWPARGVSNG